ncbi:MAG: hypothetical protein SFY66_19625 [Oculatellaceae cyanobacterium bins.114]|nr:hypothetical protein [Oculatellaceae cyanobacterium bins.114]
MPKFMSFGVDATPVQATRKQVFWMVDFLLPGSVKEGMTFEKSKQIEGRYLMGFYADPIPGDFIDWGGYQWRVISRWMSASRYNTRDKKSIPLVNVEFIGESDGF